MHRKTKLLFGIHMHQPVDNFREVIEHAVDVCYGPFFEVASRYPEFRFSVHCSGWLLEQIETHHPKLFSRMKQLADAGSIEFFGAGYYEPVLSVIPSEDRVAQLEMLNDAVASKFVQRPRGLWLTERVWESSLIPDLNRAGIAYTVMDDYHFQCAGFDEHILDGCYMTEEGGTPLGLFPISKKLRYAVPFLSVDRALEAIRSFTREEDSAAIIFDDAEKFGMWPGTYEWVYEKGWLERFIKAVLADESIETMHYGDYFDRFRPRGVAYLPNVSYYEMGEWSLKADDALKLEAFKQEMGHDRYEAEGVKFLKGGIWKNFLVKYTESNRIHKRMLELSRARTEVANPAYDDALYRLQTNDALWHGVFGGLYLPNLRDNAWHYLVACENLRYGAEVRVVSHTDAYDGYVKTKLVTPGAIFGFDAAHGGQMVECDARSARFNWQNTLTRRKEAYHTRMFDAPREAPVPVEDGIDTIHNAAVDIDPALRDAVVYDWYLRHSFIDHVTDAHFDAGSFRRCGFREFGDFTNQPFDAAGDAKGVTFRRIGGLYFPEKRSAVLEKRFDATERGLAYAITLETETREALRYVMEHNFHFADYDAVRINGQKVLEAASLDNVTEVEIVDGHLGKKIVVSCDTACSVYWFPVETLSQSEKGFDLTVQGIAVAMVFPFSGTCSVSGTLEISDV